MINGKKVALIFGISGQDGSYLAEILLQKGYLVRGVVRRASFPNTKRIDHLDVYDDRFGKTDHSPFYLLYGDLSDSASIRTVIEKVKPDEIYNLAAQSHVGISFENPESTMNYNALGPLRILEAIRDIRRPQVKCSVYLLHRKAKIPLCSLKAHMGYQN
jgi:GDPmannose 4,6-dehydratase